MNKCPNTVHHCCFWVLSEHFPIETNEFSDTLRCHKAFLDCWVSLLSKNSWRETTVNTTTGDSSETNTISRNSDDATSHDLATRFL